MDKITSEIKITKADTENMEEIIPLYLNLNQYHYNNIDDYYKEYTKNKVEKLIRRAVANEKIDIYIAKNINDAVVGLVEIEYKDIEDNIELLDKEYIEIQSLIVNPSNRGEGIGTKLIKLVDDLAQKHDKAYVELKVYGFNDSAIKFYQKNGFEPFAYYYRKNQTL